MLMKIHGLAITLAVLLLALVWASPALAGPVGCTTYEEKTMGRLQTLCDDGTRSTSELVASFRYHRNPSH
jgi:hypothetical protein